MREIRMLIECPDCKGTGVYSGMGESKNTAVVAIVVKEQASMNMSILIMNLPGERKMI